MFHCTLRALPNLFVTACNPPKYTEPPIGWRAEMVTWEVSSQILRGRTVSETSSDVGRLQNNWGGGGEDKPCNSLLKKKLHHLNENKWKSLVMSVDSASHRHGSAPWPQKEEHFSFSSSSPVWPSVSSSATTWHPSPTDKTYVSI